MWKIKNGRRGVGATTQPGFCPGLRRYLGMGMFVIVENGLPWRARKRMLSPHPKLLQPCGMINAMMAGTGNHVAKGKCHFPILPSSSDAAENRGQPVAMA